MNDGASAKQQIVERIKDSSNILVTVSANPSVDELSAALGLTIMLNGLKKHATAVMSGNIPPAITFLDPEKTFENTVDSLRDFIIALDKEKADHLRYKVDGDVVKIFITPYRTTITSEDLDFSQGDYNVELVLALGVKDESNLDKALEAHGRILHDATVATLSCGGEASKLGSIDWYEPSASSISEMLVSLSEALKNDKPLLDEQISTAFLTGIVAATDRFSNNKTSSKVMTMAAQLMAAGANQQLIALKLEAAHEIGNGSDSDDQTTQSSASEDSPSENTSNKDGTTDLSEDESTKLDHKKADVAAPIELPAPQEPKKDDGSLAISHELSGDVDEVAKEVDEANKEAAAERAEDALADQLESVAPVASSTSPSIEDLKKDLAAANADVEEAANAPANEPLAPFAANQSTSHDIPMPDYEPTMGGTLNATAEQAAEDKRREESDDRNRTILSHGEEYMGSDAPAFSNSPFGAASAAPQPESHDEPLGVQLPTLPPLSTVDVPSAPAMPSNEGQTLADLDSANRAPHEDALADVHAAFESAPAPAAPQPFGPFAPTALVDPTPPTPSPFQAPPLPPAAPDFSVLPPPPLPPTPTFNPQSSEQLGNILGGPATPPPPVSNDPNQFKIPGQ